MGRASERDLGEDEASFAPWSLRAGPHTLYIRTGPLSLMILLITLTCCLLMSYPHRWGPSLCVWSEWLESHISCLRRSSRSAIPQWRGNFTYYHQGTVLLHFNSHYISPAVCSIHFKLTEELQYVGQLFSGIDVKISPEMYNSLSAVKDFPLKRYWPLWLLHGFLFTVCFNCFGTFIEAFFKDLSTKDAFLKQLMHGAKHYR